MCGIAGQISSCFDLLNYERLFGNGDSLAHRDLTSMVGI